MTTMKFQLDTLTCPSCVTKIEGNLSKIKGVDETKVMFNSSKVKTIFDESKVTKEELKNTIEKLGYPVLN